jgi:3-oxoacyl-[acyl-carrier protein] reductase
MTYGYAGRTALVTGAARGIGRATAQRLAAEGAQIVLWDRDEEALERARAELSETGARVRARRVDVADAHHVMEAMEASSDDFGRLDLVVHAAGVMSTADIEACAPEEWERVLAVNLTGTFAVCRAGIPALRRQGRGAIVLVSSGASKSPCTISGVAYVATKAGILGMVRQLAYRLGPQGIRVNAVAPGFIDTDMPRLSFPREVIERSVSAIPARRMGTAEEVAEAICYLGSDAAAYVNGETLDVNGGSFID